MPPHMLFGRVIPISRYTKYPRHIKRTLIMSASHDSLTRSYSDGRQKDTLRLYLNEPKYSQCGMLDLIVPCYIRLTYYGGTGYVLSTRQGTGKRNAASSFSSKLERNHTQYDDVDSGFGAFSPLSNHRNGLGLSTSMGFYK
eukprot:scaffold2103_cov185-Amphora_coffeaeformis.AAC.31